MLHFTVSIKSVCQMDDATRAEEADMKWAERMGTDMSRTPPPAAVLQPLNTGHMLNPCVTCDQGDSFSLFFL